MPVAAPVTAGMVAPGRRHLRGVGNTFDDADKARIDAELTRQGEHYGASKANIALAWLLRHPASIAPIIGSTTPERIREAVTSLDIDYSREDWYRLLEARNGHEVP